ncbi:hypothetical protein [Orenia marismortui]|uniref:Uncharacterized protein n=1 Tax=Orenia marismortui TaxID=46469 RepID=A0A4R8H3E6_9FIRM|nr:hypothetical protein [Orenia marismortui]TDX53270.1 hypothetical protein C7959_103122 [Orenia marismortui]
MTNAEKEFYYNLSPRDALAHDIKDARRIYMEDGLYNSEIRQGLKNEVKMNKEIYPELFEK